MAYINSTSQPTPFSSVNATNSSNNTNISLTRFNTARIVLLTLQILTVLAGIIGNIVVCVITSKNRNRGKIVGHYLILNLAVSDLGILVFFYPLQVISIEFSISWPFGELTCKAIRPFFEIFFGSGIGCMTAIAFHRYRMLVHCMKPQMSLQTAKRILFVIWLVSFLIIVMPMFFVMDLQNIPNVARVGLWICQPHWPNPLSFKLYEATTILGIYFVPLAIISCSYIRIRNKLRENIRQNDNHRRESFRSKSTGQRKDVDSRIRQNRRALRLLAPVVAVFAICMAPSIFMKMESVFAKDPRQLYKSVEYMPELVRLFQLLLAVNSAANPVIYSVVNTEFRRDFARLMGCGKDKDFANSTERLNLSTFQNSITLNGRGSLRESLRRLWSRYSADRLPERVDQEERFIELEERQRKVLEKFG
ncbi:Orexin receptor type 2 [Acropora cervicornis]|uniref:Orexin receptor type 2 n=1 Tax=Acropora cervicornis TaxID=6130 RepID=A0AAD9QVX7_ACRCE|nr:Orexin receptor type 2 [Acropora cervicornis]